MEAQNDDSMAMAQSGVRMYWDGERRDKNLTHTLLTGRVSPTPSLDTSVLPWASGEGRKGT